MSGVVRLGLLEVLDRDGRVRRSVPIEAWPLAIGRAIDNDVVLDDPHVAAYHAVLEAGLTGTPRLRALPSVNGVSLGRRRLGPGDSAELGAGDGAFSVGTTRLRLRLPGEALAPERELARAPRHVATLVLALVLWAWGLAGQAVGLDPGSKPSDWLLPTLGAPGLLLLWCLLWGLASKLFQHRLDFWSHLGVAVRGLLAVQLVAFVLPWLSALTDWAGPSRIAGGAATACAVAMLAAHGRLVLPHLKRAVALVALAAYGVGAAILLTLNHQRNERWFAELYVSVLPPPGLLWVEPLPRAEFLRRAGALRAELDRQVREARDENPDDAAEPE